MLSQIILSECVNLNATNTALRASVRLIVHKGFHNFGRPQLS